MKKNASGPIKRHESLKELSRDHHFGLLCCWKIRQGIKRNVSPERIGSYTGYFFREHLTPHFSVEEVLIFPLLGDPHALIKKAAADHLQLRRMFGEKYPDIRMLAGMADHLEQHIRFEERELFKELQLAVPQATLEKVHIAHDTHTVDEWHDEFWK